MKTKVVVTVVIESARRPSKRWLAAFRKHLLTPGDEPITQSNAIIEAGWKANDDAPIDIDYVFAEPDERPTIKVEIDREIK